MNCLEIKNLQIREKNNPLVKGIDFSIAQNEITALIGASGSGKTLTALSIMGLLQESNLSVSGEIYFFGKDLLSLTHNERKNVCLEEIAMIYQNPIRSLSPVTTIKKLIRDMYKIKRAALSLQKIELLFEHTNLNMKDVLHKYPHELSGGEAQRILIILSLLFQPRLLICDEPTASLDYTTGLKVISLLKRIQTERKMSILFISHDISLIKEFADRIIIMKNGCIIEEGTTRNIFSSPKEQYTSSLIAAAELERACLK